MVRACVRASCRENTWSARARERASDIVLRARKRERVRRERDGRSRARRNARRREGKKGRKEHEVRRL